MTKSFDPDAYFESDLYWAHRHSSDHADKIWRSGLCGCFCCLDVFEPRFITQWVDHQRTALCPSCGIDAVLPDSVGYPITPSFLQAMKTRCFGRT